MLSYSHLLQLLDSAPMLHYPHGHGVSGQRCFYYLPKVDKKESSWKFTLSLSFLLYSTLTPGGECQEKNQEKEIHQLWDGEWELWDKSGALKAVACLPSFGFAFIIKFLLKCARVRHFNSVNTFVLLLELLSLTMNLSRCENICVTLNKVNNQVHVAA